MIRQWRIQRGHQNINAMWPDYAALLTDEALLIRAAIHWPLLTGYPRPSKLFPGLDPALDDRLIHVQRDKDVTLCRILSAIARIDQGEFLELYLLDPIDAQHWVRLPAWKRPIRKGNPDDVLVWKFFIMQRLNMEQAASEIAPAWSMASQGAQLGQMFGTVMRLSLPGVQKLGLVMSAFGTALATGQELGNVTQPPWEDKGVERTNSSCRPYRQLTVGSPSVDRRYSSER